MSTEQFHMNVELKSEDRRCCPKCGGMTFIPAAALYDVSAIVSPTGRANVAAIDIYACVVCGAQVDLTPKEEKPNLSIAPGGNA